VFVTTEEGVAVKVKDENKLIDDSDVLVAEYCVPEAENEDSVDVVGDTVPLFTVPIEEEETEGVVVRVTLELDDADVDFDDSSNDPLTVAEFEVNTLKLGDPESVADSPPAKTGEKLPFALDVNEM
jgi:hypothetical protein